MSCMSMYTHRHMHTRMRPLGCNCAIHLCINTRYMYICTVWNVSCTWELDITPVPRDSNAYWIAITLFPITRSPGVYRIWDPWVITNLSLGSRKRVIFEPDDILSWDVLCHMSDKQGNQTLSLYFASLIRIAFFSMF